MSETSDSERRRWERILTAAHPKRQLSVKVGLRLIVDADRLAELEAGPFLHRGACAYCEWTTDILGAPEESDALAAEHAAQCEDNPQVKRIAELEAGIQQLAASGVAPAKLLDLLNRQERS